MKNTNHENVAIMKKPFQISMISLIVVLVPTHWLIAQSRKPPMNIPNPDQDLGYSIEGVDNSNAAYNIFPPTDCPCGPPTLPAWARRTFFPQDLTGVDIRSACWAHDRCYEIPGVDRRDCDLAFKDQLEQLCLQSFDPAKCRRKARRLHLGERIFGGRSFRIRQQEIRPRVLFYH